jgi:hypothetical protein
MDLQDAINLAKDHAEKHTLAFVRFFGPEASEPQYTTYEHVATGALIYLVIGVTLQSSFIGGMKVEDISWLDRAVTQLVFWVTVGFIVHLSTSISPISCKKNGFLVTFRVMPVAFLCGSYGSTIGFFVNHLLKFPKQNFDTVPHYFHMFVQITVVCLYMPRELRHHCSQSESASRAVAGLVALFVLAVDLVVILSPVFLDSTLDNSSAGGNNVSR